MSNNEKQSQLFSLVDLLYMPMAFYVLVLFDKIDSPLRGVLWLIIFALVQNEYISIKSTSPKYNLLLYLSDIISLFVYLLALRAIFKSNTPTQSNIGYDPMFWIFLSFLWLSYAIWNCVMIYHEHDHRKKAAWKRWRNGMFICFSITILCGVALFNIINIPISPPISIITTILQVLLFGCVAWALGGWWLKEYFIRPEIELERINPDVA
jgi:hypothetical protein